MGTARLTIDTGALKANWRALDAMSGAACETGAVVKADGYGLGADLVAEAMAGAGARSFFVAMAEEGAQVRAVVGPGAAIYVFSGHMAGDAETLAGADLIPLLNSAEQIARHVEALPDRPFGIQLDTGMNRLGLEPGDWAGLREAVMGRGPRLVMSHLACADEPGHPMNAGQREAFEAMTAGLDCPRSLAATGGTLLGTDFHYDVTRPGVGLYGGLPFAEARPVLRLDVPVIQTRTVGPGEPVGYGNAWTATEETRIATVSAGYADGLIRAMGPRAVLYADGMPCPVRGRVSMDLITVDVTQLAEVPDRLELLGPHQGVDDLAAAAGTIGYEILTSLGARYERAVA
ncbi:MAG: alanine racemase [Paracoccaceae bacterium]|nr:alanine racemase [Paracoccaceae bacterium]